MKNWIPLFSALQILDLETEAVQNLEKCKHTCVGLQCSDAALAVLNQTETVKPLFVQLICRLLSKTTLWTPSPPSFPLPPQTFPPLFLCFSVFLSFPLPLSPSSLICCPLSFCVSLSLSIFLSLLLSVPFSLSGSFSLPHSHCNHCWNKTLCVKTEMITSCFFIFCKDHQT